MAKKALRSFEHRVLMGLGDAVLRLVHVEIAASNGTYQTEIAKAERNLIVQALNQQYQLDLGMDCNRDGIPDSIQAFTESAQTSCCRILPQEEGVTKIEEFPTPKVAKVKASAKKRVSRSRKPAAPRKAKPKAEKGFLSTIFGSGDKE